MRGVRRLKLWEKMGNHAPFDFYYFRGSVACIPYSRRWVLPKMMRSRYKHLLFWLFLRKLWQPLPLFCVLILKRMDDLVFSFDALLIWSGLDMRLDEICFT